MGKLGRIVLGAVGITLTLGFLHAWLNLGFDPVRALGFGKKGIAEETRFRVGFLPVT